MKSTLFLSLIIAGTLTACNENNNTEDTTTIAEEVGTNTSIAPENVDNLEATTTTAAEVIVSDPIIDSSEMNPAPAMSDSISNHIKADSQAVAKSVSDDAEAIKEEIQSVEKSTSQDVEIIKENMESIHENEISNTTK